MNIEDIKIGETYNVRVEITGKLDEGFCFVTASLTGEVNAPVLGRSCIYNFELNALSPVTSAPKYDPCRKFKKGDKVRVRKIHGNLPQCRYNGMFRVKEGDIATISRYEERNCYWVDFPSSAHRCVDAAYLELVTPVEELEPYYIEHDSTGYAIIDRQNVGYVAHFKAVQHPHAKEAAKAECDRLNAEYRKVLNND